MPHAHVPKVTPADRIAFSPGEVTALTGLSPAFVAELIKSGALRSAKIGGRRIITARALAELLGEAPDVALPTLAVSNAAAAIGDPPPSAAVTAMPAMPPNQRKLETCTGAGGDQPRNDDCNGTRARTMRRRRRESERVDADA